MQSAGRILTILELLMDKRVVTVSEVARAMQVNPSTAQRLLALMKKQGYLLQNRDKSYRLSFKLFTIANTAIEGINIREIARPFMKELSDRIGETVNLGVLEGREVIYLEKVENMDTILGLGLRVGRQIPAQCSALGKVLLADSPDEEIRALFSPEILIQTKRTEFSITDPESLIREVAEVRKRGYAMDNEENYLQLKCVAAPIRSYDGKAVAAISVSMLTSRFSGEREAFIIREVVNAAKMVSRELGG